MHGAGAEGSCHYGAQRRKDLDSIAIYYPFLSSCKGEGSQKQDFQYATGRIHTTNLIKKPILPIFTTQVKLNKNQTVVRLLHRFWWLGA